MPDSKLCCSEDRAVCLMQSAGGSSPLVLCSAGVHMCTCASLICDYTGDLF